MIVRYLSTKGGICDGAEVPPQCLAHAVAQDWRNFFEHHSLSQFSRASGWPVDLLALAERTEKDTDTGPRCPYGPVVRLTALPFVEGKRGENAAAALYRRDWSAVSSERLAGDCFTEHLLNRAFFQSYPLFYDSEPKFPCPDGSPRLYLYSGLPFSEKPSTCAHRGLCFTEVYVHKVLQRSACRVARPQDAEVLVVPVYSSCNDLHSRPLAAKEIVKALGQTFVDRPKDHVFLFTCEMWKLSGWRRLRPARFVVVEARPLECPREGGPCHHCFNCLRPQDIVIPSATPAREVHRYQFFDREPQNREYLASFHGEHSETTSRADVAQGYKDVNETVRVRLIRELGKSREFSVGGPSMRYAFLMGNSHFCLVPKGRGWWTVRLFEAFFIGCIPVLLSDHYVPPFADWLDWSRFTVSFPMEGSLQEMAERLRAIRGDAGQLAAYHEAVREVRCWFDYLQEPPGPCSAYAGLLRALGRPGRG